ncbi:MAG: homoserine O-acetyltransferase/O-succinyltransferase family protein [Bythopirellula sp.]
MSLIAHNGLPAFYALSSEGAPVQFDPQPLQPTVRIGLLNITPDAVLQATERQFMRLVADYDAANVYVLPIGVATELRSAAAQAHVLEHYESFSSLLEMQLDALIVTGANPKTDAIENEAFWKPMLQVIDWAQDQDCSILFSCLAVHAVMQAYFDTHRVLLPEKMWGVYPHQVLDATHPLVEGIADGWAAPHSHCYDISREQIENIGGRVLVHSDVAGVHLAVCGPEERLILFQGHPEYDSNSLLKEYKREVSRWFTGERPDYPRYPENYFPAECQVRLEAYREQLENDKLAGLHQTEFPEADLANFLENGWMDSGKKAYHNWLRQMHGANSAAEAATRSVDCR